MRAPWGRLEPDLAACCGHRFCPACGRWRVTADFVYLSHLAHPRVRDECGSCIRLGQKRRRLGAERYATRAGTQEYPGNKPCLEPEPLIIALLDWHDGAAVRGEPWETLASRAGVSERLITRILMYQGDRVSLDAADRLAIALGCHLDEIYPFEEAA